MSNMDNKKKTNGLIILKQNKRNNLDRQLSTPPTWKYVGDLGHTPINSDGVGQGFGDKQCLFNGESDMITQRNNVA